MSVLTESPSSKESPASDFVLLVPKSTLSTTVPNARTSTKF